MPHITHTLASPNIGNYYIGRGIVSIFVDPSNSIGPTADTGYVDAGNATMIEFTMKPTILPHYSSRVGTRFKDFTAVTEVDATISMTLEEFTARNVAFALLGDYTDSGGVVTVTMYDKPQLFAGIKFTGTNTIGPVWTWTFPLCQLSPNKAINLLSAGSGAWGNIDLQVDVLKDPHTGLFGTAICDDFADA